MHREVCLLWYVYNEIFQDKSMMSRGLIMFPIVEVRSQVICIPRQSRAGSLSSPAFRSELVRNAVEWGQVIRHDALARVVVPQGPQGLDAVRELGEVGQFLAVKIWWCLWWRQWLTSLYLSMLIFKPISVGRLFLTLQVDCRICFWIISSSFLWRSRVLLGWGTIIVTTLKSEKDIYKIFFIK